MSSEQHGDELMKKLIRKSDCPLCEDGYLDDGDNYGTCYVACPYTDKATSDIIEKVKVNCPKMKAYLEKMNKIFTSAIKFANDKGWHIDDPEARRFYLLDVVNRMADCEERLQVLKELWKMSDSMLF